MSDIIINAAHKFNAQKLGEFLNGLSPSEPFIVKVNEYEEASTIDCIASVLDLPKKTEFGLDDDIIVCSANKTLKLKGCDIYYYNSAKPDKRRAKLLSCLSSSTETATTETSASSTETSTAETKKVAVSNEKTMIVKSAVQDYDDYIDVNTFKGTMKECVTYINKQNALLTIRHFTMIPVFDINGSGWKTIEQLRKEGIVE